MVLPVDDGIAKWKTKCFDLSMKRDRREAERIATKIGLPELFQCGPLTRQKFNSVLSEECTALENIRIAIECEHHPVDALLELNEMLIRKLPIRWFVLDLHTYLANMPYLCAKCRELFSDLGSFQIALRPSLII